jgi:hypothetical protein
MKPIEIRVSEFLTEKKVNGIAVHLSTYDVPRGARAGFDQKSGILNLAFDYIDEEPARQHALTDHIAVNVGKNSGKILGLQVSVAKYKIGEVHVNFEKALEEVDRALVEEIRHLKRANQSANYELVRSVLNESRSVVAETVSP